MVDKEIFLVLGKNLHKERYRIIHEFIKFSLIGGIGMFIDLSITYIAKDIWMLPFYIARTVGFIFALTNNFLLNRRFTFANARQGSISKQYVLFFVISIIGFSVNWTISVCLYNNLAFFNFHYLLASFLGIIGGLTINFLGNKFITFNKACPTA